MHVPLSRSSIRNVPRTSPRVASRHAPMESGRLGEATKRESGRATRVRADEWLPSRRAGYHRMRVTIVVGPAAHSTFSATESMNVIRQTFPSGRTTTHLHLEADGSVRRSLSAVVAPLADKLPTADAQSPSSPPPLPAHASLDLPDNAHWSMWQRKSLDELFRPVALDRA